MSLQIFLIIAAVIAMASLAAVRVVRVRMGREATMQGWRKIAVAIGILLIPPLVIQAVTTPTATKGSMDGVGAVLLYAGTVILLWALMWLAAILVGRYAPIERRPALLIALVGRETAPLVPYDPPMVGALADQVALVETCNAEFPRGAAFMHQVELPGFRAHWEDLDEATRALETSINEAGRLHTGIAERALNAAADARARLDALRRDAAGHGQAWAA